MQPATPYVSIIIPAYNTGPYIVQAVQSALQQTFNNLEVIVVDDASMDDTLAQLTTITDPRLRVLPNHENRGAAITRNLAIDEAQGEWIAILDSDDWYSPERIEVLLGIAEATQADMIADDQWFIKGQTTTPFTTQLTQSGEKLTEATVIDVVRFVDTDIYGGLILGLSKPIFRRSFLSKYHLRYDECLPMGHDFFLYLDCLIRGARFILYPHPYYFYRVNRADALTTKSPVATLTMGITAMEQRLIRPEVLCQSALSKSLKRRINIHKRYLDYYRVVTPLKNREWMASFVAMIQYPYFFIEFTKRLPQIVARRLPY